MFAKHIGTCLKGGSILLLLIITPISVSAYSLLPEGCFGQLTEDQVIVYYFTRKFRCQSCEILENIMLETIREHYAESFAAGGLAMCVVNVDDPVNLHYLDEFDILSNSVYIVEKRGGAVLRSRNLDEVWEVVNDPEAISRLLKTGLSEYVPAADQGGHKGGQGTGNAKGNTADGNDSSENAERGSTGKARGPGNRKQNSTDWD